MLRKINLDSTCGKRIKSWRLVNTDLIRQLLYETDRICPTLMLTSVPCFTVKSSSLLLMIRRSYFVFCMGPQTYVVSVFFIKRAFGVRHFLICYDSCKDELST